MKRNQITTKLCKNLKSNKNIIIFFTNCDNISIAFLKKKKKKKREGRTHQCKNTNGFQSICPNKSDPH